jgi:hypothetical protein
MEEEEVASETSILWQAALKVELGSAGQVRVCVS